MSGKILIYPLIKNKPFENVEDESPNEEELGQLADHYMAEVAKHLKNHKFQMNPALLKDMQVTSEFLKSAIYRNVGKWHHLQDTVDSLPNDDDEVPEEELTEESPED